MADVTDCAFRQIIAKYGKPDIFWTEFVSADGLAHPIAREKLLIDLKYGENERPIVAQIFGGKPENIKIAAALCKDLGFDGIDINMGCPDKSVEKQCAGAAMMKNPKLAREIIRAAREGGGGLPISVKTRVGYNRNEIETWIPELLKENLAALTVHLRTRKEMSDVPAHWEMMKRIVEIRDEMGVETLILGNGDIMNLKEAEEKVKETGCDGVMLGRAIFGNPFLFAPCEGGDAKGRGGKDEKRKLEVLIEHTKLFEEMLGNNPLRPRYAKATPGEQGFGGSSKNFAIMKKHFKAYVNGFDGAKELRMKLMETENAAQVEEIVSDFLTRLR